MLSMLVLLRQDRGAKRSVVYWRKRRRELRKQLIMSKKVANSLGGLENIIFLCRTNKESRNMQGTCR